MTVKTATRRVNDRFVLPGESGACVEFGFPWPDGYRCSMRVRDLSASGLSFILGRELPGLEVGQPIEGATIRWDGHAVTGDLVVMHLTPDSGAGSVCGRCSWPPATRMSSASANCSRPRAAGGVGRRRPALTLVPGYDRAPLRAALVPAGTLRRLTSRFAWARVAISASGAGAPPSGSGRPRQGCPYGRTGNFLAITA